MKATVEPLEGNKVKVSVEVDETEMDKAIDAAFRKIAQEVRIPGFRPGKAPRQLLERRFGTEVGREQALHDSLPDFYSQALLDQSVDAIAPPDIDITAGEKDGPLAFDAVVEVRPEVHVAGYDGLRITLDGLEVPDEELDAQIDRMREVNATLEEVDRPAQDDDVVTIDISGSLDGEVQDNLTADDYSYMVGGGTITPEVDTQLRGAKPGEILQFETAHPDPEEERPIEFRILVKQVSERKLPEADDEWAAEASEHSTIAELRDSIREHMSQIRKLQASTQFEQRTGEALARLVDVEPPEVLVQQETERRLQDMVLRLRAQGMDPDQIAEAGLPPEMLENAQQAAATAVRVDLALRSVARAEELDCSEEELDVEVNALADRLGQKPRRVRSELERSGHIEAVRSDVRKRKSLDWLLERVEVVDPEGHPIDRAELDLPGSTSTEGSDHDDTESDPE